MTTRRGSQYSIQSDGAGLRGRIDSSKGKRKGNIPSGTESTQGSALSQRQVPEMPMISEPELELSMSDSNRYKSHSEGSNRHLHEPIQTVLHGVQGQRLGNVASNTPRSDELLAHPEKVPQRGGNRIPCPKEGGNQGRSPSSFYQKAPSQPTSPRREEEQEKELEKTIFPKLQDPKNPKRCHGQCLQHGQSLDGIQGQGRTKNPTTSFPKEISLSLDVVNTLTESNNSILPLKDIKDSLLLFQEINKSFSSLTKIVIQNKKEIDKIKFMVENNKPKVLIDSTQKLIQRKQELYQYIKQIKKPLTINYDVIIDNLTEKLNKLSISVEKFEQKTSSHKQLLPDHVEKSYDARMNLRDDIKSEIRLITEKMGKINEASLNMPKLSILFSHIRSPVKAKEEMTNTFMTDLNYQENNQFLMKEAPQSKEWPTFTGEGE
ncbi:hypothetical protein O181_109249 [Austropuccinia psidii MF-1]|uniref:Uncharacterized protein n=1 Tax=Austropuccinia psidii MF-1 TaxID=1389203 RepID=A0A9Q3JWA3_9BASI|nr:hypothetical protein [Austropuccinia psidii MF-1]